MLDFEHEGHNEAMFSGIVEDLGRVETFEVRGAGALLRIRTRLPLARLRTGDSVAVNGACLTLIEKGRGFIAMELSAETLRRTTLGMLQPGDPVNLERAIRLGTALNGHLVSGHVDGVGKVVSITPEGNSKLFVFEMPEGHERYLVEKGSVAIDGVSLTAFDVAGRQFKCSLIPHTLALTTLGHKSAGALVNVESDLLAKQVEKLLAARLQALTEPKVAANEV